MSDQTSGIAMSRETIIPQLLALDELFFVKNLCKNHPFVDGNKRAALGASIVFLWLNVIEPNGDGTEWEELVLAIAANTLDRDETSVRLRDLLRAD